MKLSLENVCIVCVDCYNYGAAIHALQKSTEQVQFGSVKFLTDIKIEVDGIETVVIDRINTKEEYSKFIIKELYKHIDRKYVLIVQHDGFVINSSAWKEEFLSVDVIGAAWLYQDQRNGSNGGFSLRTKRLMEVLAEDEFIEITHPEDEIIGRLYRDYLKTKYGFKFPADELCDAFSFELRQPVCNTFGFHGYFHQPYKPYIVFKRLGALGDCVLMEPVLHHFHEAGYNVVVDMPVYLYDLFKNHYFPVYHKSQIDWGRIKAEKTINLDMAYEVKHHQNYLKSYFEMCGVENPVLRKPKLWPQVDANTKPFKKYCVIHIDEREQEERNLKISDSDWQDIILELAFKGYQAIQVGVRDHKIVGLEYHTATVAHAKWLIAGADLFIGVDSGMSHIAVALDIPSIIFFGSVDPNRVHCDHTNMIALQSPCDKQHCWHINGGTAGQLCYYKDTEQEYQCTKIEGKTVIESITSILSK